MATSFVALVLLCISCGGSAPPPPRGVIENNIDTWNYRRYQRLLDIEVWVARNNAVAHTASYVRLSAEKEGRVEEGDVVNAFVTRYQTDRGILRALVKFVRRLAQDGGYIVEEKSRGGVWLISVTGNNEAWALWASRASVVKIGGRGIDSVPTDVVEAYGKRYPSRIREGLLDGPLPPDSVPDEPAKEKKEYDPDNPSPDWDAFTTGDPDTVGGKGKGKGKGSTSDSDSDSDSKKESSE